MQAVVACVGADYIQCLRRKACAGMAGKALPVWMAPCALLFAGCAAGPQPPLAPAPEHATQTAGACRAAPLDTPLYLRGAMTTWTLREDFAFRWVCNAYVLNVDLHGR